MCFGSAQRSKSDVAAELTSLLALSAIRNQDKVGMILFSDRIEKYIPPRKGRTAAMRLVREVLASEETRRQTNIAEALQFLSKVCKHRAIVFLISDFMAKGYENNLRVMARRHDLIACPISDPREEEIPNVGILELLDPETGELILLDTKSKSLRNAFKNNAREDEQKYLHQFNKLKIDTLSLSTARPFIDDVHRLFDKRRRRSIRGT